MNYPEIETKVWEATIDEAWSPTGQLMQELTHATCYGIIPSQQRKGDDRWDDYEVESKDSNTESKHQSRCSKKYKDTESIGNPTSVEKKISLNINTITNKSPTKNPKPLKKVDLGAAATFGQMDKQPTQSVDLLNYDFNPRAHEKNKDKQSAASQNKRVSTPKKKVCSKATMSNLKGWLSKDNTRWKNSQKAQRIQQQKNQTDNMVLAKNENLSKSKEIRLERTSSDFSYQYGVLVPSFENIIESQNKYEKFQLDVDKLSEINYSQESLDLDIDEPCMSAAVLDCKHLTNKELENAFYKNVEFIHNICEGIEYSERHILYQKAKSEDQFTVRILNYNLSMFVFGYEQKEKLLSLISRKSHHDLSSDSQYLFKVLLPELCLKIFMDVYHMNRKDAIHYLENMPIEH